MKLKPSSNDMTALFAEPRAIPSSPAASFITRIASQASLRSAVSATMSSAKRTSGKPAVTTRVS